MTIKITNDLTQIDYPRYDSYKDSGVDWLGEIPEGWRTEKGKWLFNKMDRPIREDDGIVTCFRDGEVTLRSNRRTDGFTNALKEHGYQGIRKGDLVIHQMDAFAGAIGVSDSEGKSTPVYSVCVPKEPDQISPYYYMYFMRSMALRGFILSLAKGIRERSTDFRYNDFSKLELPLPPYNDQVKITEFIEHKTTQIDQAITLKQQQIAKLEEYKQIVIQNAVTKGLNPDVPMKDSGIDRVGSLPEHWIINKFRFSFKFQRGLNITKDDLRDKGVLCLNYGEIHSKYGFELLPEHTLKYVDYKYTETNHKSLLNNGDFVFADTSEDIAGSGNFSYINGMMQVFAGYHTLIAKPIIDFDSRFVAYLLDSRAFRGQVQQRVKGVKVYSITQSILKSTYIWLPPIDEQVKIVQELDLKMKLINETIQSYKTQIDRLKEYKTILINQAVTGKIKVN
ncbi:restriction endonuclease subunit S [Psychrobacter sp. F1192]|uniref:Restriction endonuclease subunit S n=1 Tax=Psychrobacter coccoides TaxID=2818440 RepID=A0ABS3NNF8_9GAMM|nr:restriction endonuclease subunit S [Psychrobacter coccoides]MBO1530623.1 restriction endonuclease subunit S [Psychrobacter coccoides]